MCPEYTQTDRHTDGTDSITSDRWAGGKKEDRHEDSEMEDTAHGITEPASVSHRKDSVHVKRTVSTGKDSLRKTLLSCKILP